MSDKPVYIFGKKTVDRYVKETCLRVAKVFISETIEDENFTRENLHCILITIEEAFNICSDTPYTVKIKAVFTPADKLKEVAK